jgi:hypothetical protein
VGTSSPIWACGITTCRTGRLRIRARSNHADLRWWAVWSRRHRQHISATGSSRTHPNSAIGGQGGARFNSRRGRWRLTSDGAMSPCSTTNSGTSRRTSRLRRRRRLSRKVVIEFYDSDQSFVPMLDLQLEMAYNLSRDISLKGGVQLNYLWNGINRANIATTTLNPNSAFSSQSEATGRGNW